jgi:EXLDI family protein
MPLILSGLRAIFSLKKRITLSNSHKKTSYKLRLLFYERQIPAMPNRTIYVADTDLPIFEKAQQLVGDNLSAAISQALHAFVEKEEAKRSGYEEITVRIGKGRPYLTKQFRGRLLASRRMRIQNESRLLTLVVYQTAKGRFAVYTKNSANWSDWSKWSKKSANDWDWDYVRPQYDWSSYLEENEHRLDVYDTLDDLKESIPEELYESIARYTNGEDIEILDI